MPVSELPRRGDLLIVRRQGGPPPQFRGLWANLTEWNVLELKGPTDDPEEEDLDLLVHVGTCLTIKLDEERRQRGEPRFRPGQVAFWYLARSLGETFLGQARLRSFFDYQTGGVLRGSVWGHPVYLLFVPARWARCAGVAPAPVI